MRNVILFIAIAAGVASGQTANIVNPLNEAAKGYLRAMFDTEESSPCAKLDWPSTPECIAQALAIASVAHEAVINGYLRPIQEWSPGIMKFDPTANIPVDSQHYEYSTTELYCSDHDKKIGDCPTTQESSIIVFEQYSPIDMGWSVVIHPEHVHLLDVEGDGASIGCSQYVRRDHYIHSMIFGVEYVQTCRNNKLGVLRPYVKAKRVNLFAGAKPEVVYWYQHPDITVPMTSIEISKYNKARSDQELHPQMYYPNTLAAVEGEIIDAHQVKPASDCHWEVKTLTPHSTEGYNGKVIAPNVIYSWGDPECALYAY